jgi:hypothetical protein
MSTQVLVDCFVKIGETEFTLIGTHAAISHSAESLDNTAFGTGYRSHTGGLKDWSMSFEFLGDESQTGPLFDLLGTVVLVEVRPENDEISATNPAYTGNALITELDPFGGEVGALKKVRVSMVSAGVLYRVIAPTTTTTTLP